MNTKVTKWVKCHRFSIILTTAILYLSLFTPPKTKIDDVAFADKWAHLVMYGTYVFTMCHELYRSCKSEGTPWGRWLLAALWAVGYSGMMELAQAYFTTTRSGDWIDFAANAAGAGLGLGIASVYARCTAR